jgi:hypothetical protein
MIGAAFALGAMRFPWITRAAHERILRACEDAALERLEAELARADRAHADALDRFRGRMRPAAREAADARESAHKAHETARRWVRANWDDFNGTGSWTR